MSFMLMSLDVCHILDLGILCAVCCLGFLLWGLCFEGCALRAVL